MRRVLLAWEMGRGSGHVVTLHDLGRLLAAEGLNVVVALRDLAASGPFVDAGIEVVQAPVWPLAHKLGTVPGRPATSVSMGDMLAMAGLAYAPELEAMMRAWRGIFKAFRIDMVVAEFAPGAALAARGHLPLAVVGTGYSLPPSEMAEFPLLHSMSAPVWNADEVTATINAVLQKFSGKVIGRMPQVFEADASYINTLPVLDPYRQYRSRPADGPISSMLPEMSDGKGKGVFAYLSTGWDVPSHLIEALAEVGSGLSLFGPGLSQPQITRLRTAGVDCRNEPLSFQSELCRYGLLLHYGVGGTSNAGLLTGIPQLALSTDIEKELNGEALQQLGVGKLIKFHDPKARVSAKLISDMANDAALSKRARDAAMSLRAEIRPGAITEFIAACVRLAG